MANPIERADPVDESYAVRPDADVSISIVIGNGQFGTIRVKVNAAPLAAGKQQLTAVAGKGADVEGKIINVFSIVDDVNPATNDTIVTYTLTGGNVPKAFQRKHTLKDDWGIVFHRAKFHLTPA